MKSTLRTLVAIAVLVSFGAHAEVASTKGRPTDPPPSDCKYGSGHTYGSTITENLDYPQLNGTDLLVCIDKNSKKRYFRLRLSILVKKADGVLENQIADEIIIPWRRGVYANTLAVADVRECSSTEIVIAPTELGPYALGVWDQQSDESLLLKQIITAWKIDVPSKTLMIVSSKKLVCSSRGC
jgi:hypothetical protein